MNGLLSRRALLLVPFAGACAPAWGAFAEDGPARVRAMAVKGVLLDLTQAGARLVAVGERGHVVLSDDRGKTWRQARSVPTRAMLTCVHATDERTLWAAGHGGVILQSLDVGESWSLIDGKASGADVLLSIRVDADGRGLAVGGFGLARRTSDGGKTWLKQTLLDGEAGEKHLNRILVTAASTWLIAAEGGHLLRSTDRGDHWQAIKTPYAGSLWNGVQLPGATVLVCGMRGNVVRSADDGRSWSHDAVVGAGSLTGAAVLGDGRACLVGLDGTLVLGDQRGENLELTRIEDRPSFTAVSFMPGDGKGTVIAASGAGLRTLEVSG